MFLCQDKDNPRFGLVMGNLQNMKKCFKRRNKQTNKQKRSRKTAREEGMRGARSETKLHTWASARTRAPQRRLSCAHVWAQHVWISSLQRTSAYLQFTASSLLPHPTSIPRPLPGALFRSVPTFAALCLSLPFPSVHCFGLQLLYLLRLTAGLALPLGFRMGNVLAERGRRGVDNRSRRGPWSATQTNPQPPPSNPPPRTVNIPLPHDCENQKDKQKHVHLPSISSLSAPSPLRRYSLPLIPAPYLLSLFPHCCPLTFGRGRGG